jgi:hypothetical protein
MIILYAFLTFLSGFTIDFIFVYWVHYSERNKAYHTAVCAFIVGIAQVFGIGESIHNSVMGFLFAFGYSIGAYVAVKRKTILK